MTARLLILGATGDLTKRYLLPALAQLEHADRWPGVEVVAIGLEPWDTAAFRQRARDALERHAAEVSADARERLVDRLVYVEGDVTDPAVLRRAAAETETFGRKRLTESGIRTKLGTEGAGETDGDDVVAYLALPPAVFAPAIEALGALGLPRMRVVVEKPFGTDLASARALNELLLRHFPEQAVFRMDHFLGKQTVQNVLGLRFANRVFEPLWCNAHVKAVDIIWDETVALEGRAGYYDATGALRDMVQNHLLQVLALVAMERPRGPGAEALRDAKAEVLRCIEPLGADHVRTSTRRARYTAGRIGSRDMPDYAAEEGVDPGRGIETFVEVTFSLDDDRWRGVPFRLRTGKALATARREIHIHFLDADPLPFAPQDDILPNRLILSMDPDVMALDIALNGAGDPFNLEPARLHLELAPKELSAYAGLLLDAFDGDPSLSIRADEAELSWRAIEPIVAAWDAGATPLEEYEAGSSGPPASLITEPPR